jgi:hypothetical protein
VQARNNEAETEQLVSEAKNIARQIHETVRTIKDKKLKESAVKK